MFFVTGWKKGRMVRGAQRRFSEKSSRSLADIVNGICRQARSQLPAGKKRALYLAFTDAEVATIRLHLQPLIGKRVLRSADRGMGHGNEDVTVTEFLMTYIVPVMRTYFSENRFFYSIAPIPVNGHIGEGKHYLAIWIRPND